MDRRGFLAKSFSALMLLNLQGCSSLSGSSRNSKLAYILCGDGLESLGMIDTGYRLNQPGDGTRVAVISLIDGKTRFISTPGKGHEIVINPKKKGIAFGASKWGQDAFLVDYDKGILLKSVKTERTSLQFFGHGVFSSDGERIYCTMSDHAKSVGYISVRDSQTLEEISQIKTFGIEPHQVRWHIEDEVLCVVNDRSTHLRSSENNSSLNFINVRDGSLVERISLKSDRYSHFTIADKKGIVCRSSSKSESETLVESFDLKSKQTEVFAKAFIPGSEALSHVLLPDLGLAVITVIQDNKVVVWDYEKNKLLQVLDLKATPRGIALAEDMKSVYISMIRKEDPFIRQYLVEDLVRGNTTSVLNKYTGGTGSHLTMVYGS